MRWRWIVGTTEDSAVMTLDGLVPLVDIAGSLL
jgi:hypothetical protein